MTRKSGVLFIVVASVSSVSARADEPVAAPIPAVAPVAPVSPAAIVPMPACPACAPTPLPMARPDCPETGRRAIGLRVGRILTETALGLGLGVLVAGVGMYGGLNFDLATSGQAGPGMSVGAALGLGLGAATGVYLGGLSLQGDGSFGWALLGTTVGTAAAAGLVAIDNHTPMLAFAATVPVALGIAGYELSSHFRRPAAPRTTALRLVPVFSVTSAATSVGVVGVF